MGYLVIDQATSYITPKVLSLLKRGNREVSIIPGGLVRFFQPLDVAINKPFKHCLKELYISYCIKNVRDKTKISRTKMIEFICNTWYGPNKIIDKMIYHSFRATGIANKLNHQEDKLFSSWRKMENKMPLIDNNLEKNYSLDNEEIKDGD